MNWHEITVHTTEEAVEIVSYFIHELGAAGVSIEDSSSNFKKMDTTFGQIYEFPINDVALGRAVIKGYFENNSDITGIIQQLQHQMNNLSNADVDTGQPEFSVRLVDEEDWANNWKQYFKPIHISERIVIKPLWEPLEPTEQQIVIELDPGMAFGTGSHASTTLCIHALEKILQGHEQVIDIGTGSGILAIAAAKLGARHVLALDLDPVAIESAIRNIHQNQLDHQVTIIQSDLLQVLHHEHSQANDHLNITLPVQIVVANILAEVIVKFTSDVYAIVQSGGFYITSGIIRKKEQIVIDSLVSCGFEIMDRQYEEDWVAIIAKKP